MLLLVGAILALSVVVALGAARTGLPVLVAFLALGMLLGSDGPGRDRVRRRRARARGRHRRPRADPLRGRPADLVAAAATGRRARGAPQHGRRRREHAPHRRRRARALRPHVARGDPARRGRRVDRRGRRLRDAALHAHPAPPRAHARGRVGRQRPDGDRADARADRVDREPGRLRARDLALLVVRSSASASSSASPSARLPPGSSRASRTRSAPFAPVASLAAAALSFGAADVIGGSGFLAVYLVGLAVGSTPSRYRRQLVAFHEGLAFLAQVALFIVLGLLVFPRELPDGRRRRASRSRSLARAGRSGRSPCGSRRRFSDFTARERLLLGWAGLRGAVPIVLATFVLSSDGSGTRTRSSTPSSSSSSSRRSCRGRRSSGSQGGSGCSRPRRPRHEAPLEVGPAEPARAGRLRRRGRPRDRRRSRPRARAPAERDRSPSSRAGSDSIPPRGQHGHPARRPPLRPRPAVDARRTSRTSSCRWRRRI